MQQLNIEERRHLRIMERKRRQEERSRDHGVGDTHFQVTVNGNVISKDKEQTVKILLLEPNDE